MSFDPAHPWIIVQPTHPWIIVQLTRQRPRYYTGGNPELIDNWSRDMRKAARLTGAEVQRIQGRKEERTWKS